MRKFFCELISICSTVLIFGTLILGLISCNPTSTQATSINPNISPMISPLDTPIITATASAIPQPATPTQSCNDNLLFIDDATIPDNTVVSTGEKLDKQWLIQNNGNCNWDIRYRLRLISGDALGAVPEQALYPARAGTQIKLRILFTAPQKPGIYVSEWQAFDPNGLPFGDSFYLKIIVE